MAIVITDDKHYTQIAQAIRAKTGSTGAYRPSEMAGAISGISTGGGIGLTAAVSHKNIIRTLAVTSPTLSVTIS